MLLNSQMTSSKVPDRCEHLGFRFAVALQLAERKCDEDII